MNYKNTEQQKYIKSPSKQEISPKDAIKHENTKRVCSTYWWESINSKLYQLKRARQTTKDVTGLKPRVETILEIRGDEIIITKPKITCNYTDYYTSTQAKKLKKVVNIKKIIEEEVAQKM